MGFRAIVSFALYKNPDDPATVDRKIVHMTDIMRVAIVSMQVIRIGVCLLLFIAGIKLLFATKTIINLILNSVALQFVFEVDELVVRAMLPRHDHARLENVGSIPVQLHNGITMFCGSFTGRVGTFWAWLRFVVVAVLVTVICWTHHIAYRSFLSRAETICLTSGITDGMNDVDWTKAVAPIVFPFTGVCESFVDNFAGLGRQNCTAFKDHRDQAFTRGYCSNRGDLETAPWSNSHVTGDEKLQNVCTEMWFGLGLAPGAHHVPALKNAVDKKNLNDHPQMFGCRKEDIVITREHHYNLLHGLILGTYDDVFLKCKRPAFGPRSAAWEEDSLRTGVFLPSEFFYKFDPKSPIERQADSCLTLEAAYPKVVPFCNFDRCRVVANVGKGGTCSKYCEKYGLACSYAAEDLANTCAPKKKAQCDKPYGDTSDLVCECHLPPEKRFCGKLDTVKKRCPKATGDIQLDPCRVLLNTEKAPGDNDVKYKSCTQYCEHAGLKCVSQYNTRPWSCDPVPEGNKYFQRLTCDSDLELKFPSRVCECAPKDNSDVFS